MKRKMKRFLAALMAGTLICSNLPVDAIAIEVNAAEETQMETQESLSVNFDSPYAQVGEALSVTVTGGTDVSYQWYVGGVKISNGTNAYTPTESDLEQWIEVVVTSGTEEVSTKLYCSKLPVVYIETENGASITSKEDYINATMTIQGNETYNSETSTLYDGAIEIRGRGNSTWSLPKKPYKIKLDKKTDVFGMGKNKHWVLLANYLDESLMRNTLSYDFSGSLEMNQMSTVWVDVVLNGDYVGNYQFCEQVRVDETRVDVFDWESFAEDAAAIIAETEGLTDDQAGDLETYMLEENMGWITSGEVTFNEVTYQISDYPEIEIPEIDGGYVLELDEYYDEVSKFYTNSGQPIMFKNPEFVATNADMMEYVQTYVQAFEDAVRSSDYTATYEGEEVHYSELYDFDALVDYWLVSEIFYNEELNKKSTYMYKANGELMKMGPIWDMDWSSGAAGTSATATDQWATNYFSTNAQAEQWYKYLVQDPYFLMKVQERYWEIRDVQVQAMLDSIDVHYEYLKESGAADTERWSGRVSFENDVDNLQNWLNTHVEWMDRQMATEASFEASFYNAESGLQLALADSEGVALSGDAEATVPADTMTEDGTELKLTITGNADISGTTEVYINSQKYTTAEVSETAAEVAISAEALTAAAGEKNSIEVKVVDAKGNVSAANYITVREYAVGEMPEEPEVIDLSVSFENSYAKVGEALKADVTGTSNVSYQWYVGGTQISNNTSSYTPTESDLEQWIEVVVTSGVSEASAKLYCSKLPVIYIDTENGAEITSKEDYINATMTIQGNDTYNSETSTLYDGAIEIRGRGNSTWPLPKKPYKIKLDKKTSVFDMGKNKHWVLLANYLDESLMRNTLAYDFSGSLEMNQMSTVWVDVVMNGEYVGNYQFCEQVRVDETRVDVFDWESFAEDSGAIIAEAEGLNEDDMAEYMLENMGWITSGEVTFNEVTYQISDYPDIVIPSIDGGYVLELDEYYDEVSKFYTNSGQPIMFKNPEFVATNDDMMAYVQAYVQGFEDAVMSSDYTATYEGEEVHYSELYDFDALVDYWLISEIFYNEELNKKSTYMYKANGELMKMGPIWDMDWSSGAAGTSATATNQWATNYFNANAQAEQWYKYLVKDPYFIMKVQERYWEIRDVQIQDMLDSIDVHYEYLKESGAADTETWPDRISFDDDVANLKNWLNTHITWMDQQMATEDKLNASFYASESSLQLVLTDTAGNTLARDGAEKAAADSMTEDGTELKLTITGSTDISGTAEIYVNSQKYATAEVSEKAAEVMISEADLAAVGEKNTIEVKVMDGEGEVIAVNYVTVREYEVGEMPEEPEISTDPSDDSKDYDVSKIKYTTGSNDADGEGIELAFDGLENTFWHTEYRPSWYGNESCENYLWVEFALEEATKVDAIRYLPRQDSSVNGHILSYRVEGTVDGVNWSAITEGMWTYEDKGWKIAEFDAIELMGLRLVATSTDSGSDTDRYVSAAELRVRTVELTEEPDNPDEPDVSEDPTDDSKDYDVTKITYTTGSEQPQAGAEGPIAYAFDGIESTYWHSEWEPKWYGTEECENYLWVQFDLDEAAVADAIRYLSRPTGSRNGDITSYRVEGTVDGTTWTTLTEGTWESTDQEWKLAKFDAVEVVGLRLIITGTIGDSAQNKFASASELRVRTAVLEETPEEVVNPFEDVHETDYYYNSVLWAVGEGVTSGKTATTFAPDELSTRGDVVTFMWRAAGCPEPASTESPFEDVYGYEYYYKAVLWAAEQGIAAGTSEHRFSPNNECSRAQVVTFLWRAAGKVDPPTVTITFKDIQSYAYYYDAVLWAVANGITSGTSETTFEPNSYCTRGQIVTFLYRYYR